jgi:hypothetical protein
MSETSKRKSFTRVGPGLELKPLSYCLVRRRTPYRGCHLAFIARIELMPQSNLTKDVRETDCPVLAWRVQCIIVGVRKDVAIRCETDVGKSLHRHAASDQASWISPGDLLSLQRRTKQP